MDKPYIAAADHNKDAILAALAPRFAPVRTVLEIGAGTGQHAVHFARALPHLCWQTSDRAALLPGIEAWRAEAALANLLPAIALDVATGPWPAGPYDAVYASNTVHCMAWPVVAALFAGVAAVLRPGGLFALYGPFNIDGRYVSEGNRRLDAWLASQDPAWAIRDRAALVALATGTGLELCEDCALPANNRLLFWRRDGVRAEEGGI